MSLLARFNGLARTASRPLVRQMHVEQKGIPGANLPFSINNRYKLLAYFVLFFGSGLTAPFILTRHQLLKD